MIGQSVMVAIAMWLIVTLTNIGDDAGGRMAKHAIALFLALCLPVSNGVFSIKTAAQWEWGDAENALTYWAQMMTTRLSSWTSGTTPS